MINLKKILMIFCVIFSSLNIAVNLDDLQDWKNEFHSQHINQRVKIHGHLMHLRKYLLCEKKLIEIISKHKIRSCVVEKIFAYIEGAYFRDDCLQDLIKVLCEEGLQDLVLYLLDFRDCIGKLKEAIINPAVFSLYIILLELVECISMKDKATFMLKYLDCTQNPINQ